MANSLVTLKVNNQEYELWSNVHIRKSMTSIAGTFALGTVDFGWNTTTAATSGGKSIWQNVRLGDSCEILINRQTVCTGYVEDMPLSYNSEDHFLHITGRDKTADLVDCSHDGDVSEWKGLSVFNIITNLCSPFGVQVIIDDTVTTEANTIIDTFKANEGEFVYNMISELCRDNSILPVSFGDGKLTLTRGTTDNFANDSLEFDVNVTDGVIQQSNMDRYSDYIVKGTGIGNDNKQITDYTEPTGTAFDTVIDRHRPLVIFADRATDTGKCINRAKWEARLRAGNSRSAQYMVGDWIQRNNKIWELNTLVSVKDTFAKIDDIMLINSLDFVLDDDAARTVIGLVDKDTYSIAASARDIKLEFDK